MADAPSGGDIKVPGIGDVPKKYVIGGVVVGGGIAVIVFLRARSSANAAAAANTTSNAGSTTANSAIDPATGIPYSEEGGYGGYASSGIDPATGIPYAEEAGYGGSDYGGYGAYGSGTGYDAAGYPIGSEADLQWQQQQSGGGSGITTNEEWLQAAENDLGNTAAVTTALTMVLGGLTVTTAQKGIFDEALGIEGQPPGGYPKPIKTSDTGGHPGGGGGGKVKIPNVDGLLVEQASQILTAQGLKVSAPKGLPGQLHVVTSTTPSINSSVNSGSTVTLHFKTERTKGNKVPVGKKLCR